MYDPDFRSGLWQAQVGHGLRIPGKRRDMGPNVSTPFLPQVTVTMWELVHNLSLSLHICLPLPLSPLLPLPPSSIIIVDRVRGQSLTPPPFLLINWCVHPNNEF